MTKVIVVVTSVNLDIMQRKIMRPETTILRKVCLQGWPSTGFWELGFRKGATIPRTGKNGSLCLNYIMWSMLNSCFPSGSLEFGMCQAEVPTWPASKKLWALGLQWAFLVNISHVLSQLYSRKVCPVLTQQGKTLGSLHLVSSGLYPECLSLCWCCFVSFHCNKTWL